MGAYSFSIPAQNANEALTELAKQANTTLLFPFDLAKKVKTNALEGTFTLNEALAQLLEGPPFWQHPVLVEDPRDDVEIPTALQ